MCNLKIIANSVNVNNLTWASSIILFQTFFIWILNIMYEGYKICQRILTNLTNLG